MNTFSNYYIEVFVAPGKIVVGRWKNTHSSEFDDRAFRNAMLEWFEVVKANPGHNVLADARDFVFTISPNTQTWINEKCNWFVFAAWCKQISFSGKCRSVCTVIH